jgi:hypothetical protein
MGNNTTFANATDEFAGFWDWLISGGSNDSAYADDLGGDGSGDLVPVEDVSINGVLTALVLNGAACVVLLFTYEVLRRVMPSVYSSVSEQVAMNSMQSQRLDDSLMGISTSIFPLWIVRVLRVPWTQVREVAGLDAYMYLRYIRMCARITLVSTFWALLILFPVFATGGGNAVGWYHFSMSNVLQSDWRIWPPTIFMYLFSGFTLWCMRQEYRHYLAQRMEFLSGRLREVHPQQQYSIMVEIIPKELRSDKALFDYFNALYPGRVHSACVVLNLPELETESQRRKRKVRRLEKSVAWYEANGERPRHVVGRGRLMCCGIESDVNYRSCLCCGMANTSCANGCCRRNSKPMWDEFSPNPPQKGDLVDSIAYYTLEVEEANDRMAKEQRKQKELAEIGNEDLADSATWIDRMMNMASAAASSVIGPGDIDIDMAGDGQGGGVGVVNVAPPSPATAAKLKYVIRYGATEEGLHGNGSGSASRLTSIHEEVEQRRASRVYSPTAAAATAKQNEGDIGIDDSSSLGGGSQKAPSTTSTESRRKLFPDLVKTVMRLQGKEMDETDEQGAEGAGNWHMMQEELLDPNLLWEGDEGDEAVEKDRGWCMVIIGRLGWDFVKDMVYSASNRLDVVFDNVLGTTMSSTGFVTFKDLTTVTSAASAPLSYAPGVLQCAIAPEPRDIVWKNAHRDKRVCEERESVASFLVGFGALLWSVPLALIQALATADSLAKVPGMQWILANDSVATFVNGYLPVVALLTLILILPLIFEFIATSYEHRKFQSDVQHSVFRRYFYYQVSSVQTAVVLRVSVSA